MKMTGKLGAQWLLLPKPRLRLLPSHGSSWDGLLSLQVSQPLLPLERWGSWRTTRAVAGPS